MEKILDDRGMKEEEYKQELWKRFNELFRDGLQEELEALLPKRISKKIEVKKLEKRESKIKKQIEEKGENFL